MNVPFVASETQLNTGEGGRFPLSRPPINQQEGKIVEFVNELPPVLGRGVHTAQNKEVAEACRNNPNKYTCIRTYENNKNAAYTYAANVNKGVIQSLSGLRAYVRTEDGVNRVYVAHVTEDSGGS